MRMATKLFWSNAFHVSMQVMDSERLKGLRLHMNC